MRRTIEFVRRELQQGGLLLWIACLVIAVGFAVDALINPERMYASLLFMLLGMIFGWRYFLVWKRMREQGGLVLLGTDDT